MSGSQLRLASTRQDMHAEHVAGNLVVARQRAALIDVGSPLKFNPLERGDAALFKRLALDFGTLLSSSTEIPFRSAA